MEDCSSTSSQWLQTALACHDPSKLFDLICDINRYERSQSNQQHHGTPSTVSTSVLASSLSTKNLARTVALGKLAVRQNKREQAIRTASAGLSFYNETVQKNHLNTNVTTTDSSSTSSSSAAVASPLLWNIQGALLNEILASWSTDDIVFYQRAIQLLQASFRISSYLDIDIYVNYIRLLIRYSQSLQRFVSEDIYNPNETLSLSSITLRRGLAQAVGLGCSLLLEYCSNAEPHALSYEGLSSSLSSLVPLYNETTGVSFREALESVCKPVPTSISSPSTTKDQQIQNAQLLNSVPSNERLSVLTFMIAVLLAHACWALASKNGTMWDVRSEFEKILNHITHGSTGKILPVAPSKLRTTNHSTSATDPSTGNNKLSAILPSPLTSSLTNADMVQGKTEVWDLVFLAFRLAIQNAPEPAAAAEVTLAMHDALAEYSSLHATCSLQERKEFVSSIKKVVFPNDSPLVDNTVLSENSVPGTQTTDTNDGVLTDAETEILIIDEEDGTNGDKDHTLNQSTLFGDQLRTNDISMMNMSNNDSSNVTTKDEFPLAPGLRVNVGWSMNGNSSSLSSSSSTVVGTLLNFTTSSATSSPQYSTVPSWNMVPQLSPGSASSYPESSPDMSPCSTEQYVGSNHLRYSGNENTTNHSTFGRSVSVLSFTRALQETPSHSNSGIINSEYTPPVSVVCARMQPYDHSATVPSFPTVTRSSSLSSDDSMHIEENVHELSSISHISSCSSSDDRDGQPTDGALTGHVLPLSYRTPVSKNSSLQSNISFPSSALSSCSNNTQSSSSERITSSSTSKLVKLIQYNAEMLRSIAEPFCLKCLDNGIIVEEGIPYHQPPDTSLLLSTPLSSMDSYDFPVHSSSHQVMEGLQQLHLNETIAPSTAGSIPPSTEKHTVLESLLGSRSSSSSNSVSTSPSNGDHDRKRSRTSEDGTYSPIHFTSSSSSSSSLPNRTSSTQTLACAITASALSSSPDAFVSIPSSATVTHSINRPAPNNIYSLLSSSSSSSPSKTPSSPLPPSIVTTTPSSLNDSFPLADSPGRPTAFKIRSPLGSPFRAGTIPPSSPSTRSTYSSSSSSSSSQPVSPSRSVSAVSSTVFPESSPVVSLSSTEGGNSSSMMVTDDSLPSSVVSDPFVSSSARSSEASVTETSGSIVTVERDTSVLSPPSLKIILSPILTPRNSSRTLSDTVTDARNNRNNSSTDITNLLLGNKFSTVRTLSSGSTVSYDEQPSPSLLSSSGNGSLLPHRRSRGRVRWSAEVIEQQDTRRRLRLASLEENMLWDVSLAHPLSSSSSSSSSANTSPLLSSLSPTNFPNTTFSPLSSPCTSPRMNGLSYSISHPLSPPPCPSPIPPAGPLLSSSVSTLSHDQYNLSSRLKGCWPIKIPSQRCWPANPPHHSPLSPAFSHRLWYMYSHSNTTENRMMMSVTSYYAHHHAFLDDDEYDRLVVALKRAISAAQSEVECYKEWQFIPGYV